MRFSLVLVLMNLDTWFGLARGGKCPIALRISVALAFQAVPGFDPARASDKKLETEIIYRNSHHRLRALVESPVKFTLGSCPFPE